MEFVNLHIHSEKSLLDGASSVDEIVQASKALGQTSLAITDHGNLHAWPDLAKSAHKHGINPIFGVEAYMSPRGVIDEETGEEVSRFTKHKVFYGNGEDSIESGGEVSRGAYTHLTILAKNKAGIISLIKIISEANKTGFYTKPRVDLPLIREYNEGKNLVVLTGCPSSELNVLISQGKIDRAKEYMNELIDVFGKENTFVEVMAHGFPEDNNVERNNHAGLISISRQFGLPLVATNDSHYAYKTDEFKHELCLCVGTKSTMLEKPTGQGGTRFAFDGSGYHVRSGEEIREALIEDGFPEDLAQEAIETTVKIANMCSGELLPKGEGTELWPEVDVPEEYEGRHGEYLFELSKKRLSEIYNRPLTDEEIARLDYEVNKVISPKGFADYFLFTMDFVLWAKSKGILVGPGRGSAGGALTSFALGITLIDSLKWELPFERFLNPERSSPPDIDIDFNKESRGAVIQYLSDKYGENSVAHLGTFQTLKGRMAVKDAVRALGFPASYGFQLAELLPPPPEDSSLSVYGHRLEETIKKWENDAPETPDEKTPWNYKENYRRILKASLDMESVVRGAGTHACGVVVSSRDITDYAPIHIPKQPKRKRGGTLDDEGAKETTQWEYGELESMGFIKVDILGLRTLEVLKAVHQAEPWLPTLDELIMNTELDDPKVYNLLRSTYLTGVFQSEGGVGPIMKSINAENIKDVAISIALFRPGPLGMKTPNSYAGRKFGKESPEDVEEKWKKWRSTHHEDVNFYLAQEDIDPNELPPYQHYYIHKELESEVKDILKDTFGLCCYQEDVSNLAMRLAGYTPGQADNFRRAIGKKKIEVLEAQYEPFKEGMMKNGYSEDAVKAVWQVVVPFAGYGFNKAHAFGYALLTYATAYYKAYAPASYYSAIMEVYRDNAEKVEACLNEARHARIEVLPPLLGKSKGKTSAEGRAIRLGMSQIKGITGDFAQRISEAPADKGIVGVIDYLQKHNQSLTKTRWEALVKAGVFDLFGSRGALLSITDSVTKTNSKIRKAFNPKAGEFVPDAEYSVPEIVVPELGEDRFLDVLEWEKSVLGRPVSGHSLDRARAYCVSRQLARPSGWENKNAEWRAFERISHVPPRTDVTLCAVLLHVNSPQTAKSGKRYIRVQAETIDGQEILLMAFGNSTSLFTRGKLKNGDFVEIEGTILGEEGTIAVNNLSVHELNRDGLIVADYYAPVGKARELWSLSNKSGSLDGKVLRLHLTDLQAVGRAGMDIPKVNRGKDSLKQIISANTKIVDIAYNDSFAQLLSDYGFYGNPDVVFDSMVREGQLDRWKKA